MVRFYTLCLWVFSFVIQNVLLDTVDYGLLHELLVSEFIRPFVNWIHTGIKLGGFCGRSVWEENGK